ncbi:MAG TPA: cytochrome c nitrite reductase small subunit [Clostridia bacterium]|nr:cytochrome c nitrite reductase small subunit [Clostridia bacterium]
MKPGIVKAIILLGCLTGAALGVGAYTFIYAKGGSYLTNDPAACANCHIMQDHYKGWVQSSHRSVATCNDCHTPPGLIGKYVTKANNGFWHSFAFTTGQYPDPIRIKGYNKAVAERACRKCHQDLVIGIEGHRENGEPLSCIRCHSTVGHPK